MTTVDNYFHFRFKETLFFKITSLDLMLWDIDFYSLRIFEMFACVNFVNINPFLNLVLSPAWDKWRDSPERNLWEMRDVWGGCHVVTSLTQLSSVALHQMSERPRSWVRHTRGDDAALSWRTWLRWFVQTTAGLLTQTHMAAPFVQQPSLQ